MKAHPRVAWQVVGERAVLVDREQGRALALNETGSFLWSRLEGRSEAELVLELTQAFDVTGDRAASDVRDFLALLRERGFLEL
jgi:hypothetical protein